MTTMHPPRRWLRWVAVVLLVVLAWFGATAWMLARDRERVAGLAADAVREATGLALEVRGAADVSWWPLGIRLGDVRVALPGGAPLARADALGANVPWSVIWTREPVLQRIELEGLQVDLDALDALPALRAADGPVAPLRWPALGERLVVRDARLVRAGAEPIVVTLDVEPIAVDTNLRIDATVARAGRTMRIRVDGVAKNEAGLTLMPADIDIDGLGFDGALRIVGGSNWSAAGQLAAAASPEWLDQLIPGATPRSPVNLEVELSLTAGRLALRANGTAAGATVDVDLAGIELPQDGGIAAWFAFATSPALRGSASLDRWQAGDVLLEGIELRADPEAAK